MFSLTLRGNRLTGETPVPLLPESALPDSKTTKNSQKQGLPSRKSVNSLTPLLEPAAEKA